MTKNIFLIPILAAYLFSCSTKPIANSGTDTNSDRAIASGPTGEHNRLQPFTSDGCSRFFDGIPWSNDTLWRPCCVVHDISYWKGGTAEERKSADLNLRACVRKVAGPVMAEIIYRGVRLGGYQGLPTTWRWGYGWVMDRGYSALAGDEQTQVQNLQALIPKDLRQVKIESPPVVPVRPSLSGDYCYDAAIKNIEATVGRRVDVKSYKSTVRAKTFGYVRAFRILTNLCPQPIEYSFNILTSTACRTPMNELLARGEIRMSQLKWPAGCSPGDGIGH